ncbi:hypothetical protein CathTA2_2237 [Caldalkalibacillus thermarum TA2.A1]|uniref:Uncharacterized protein n=1 Tax=Caldalkalibacillus thermarum (strain TA2.A1) TaxID=986075 RepID=F5L8T2_CALTT|nr:hypothetical protein CathTA2_2237 [Caldalkalibacillus thermarum TA2.A1]
MNVLGFRTLYAFGLGCFLREAFLPHGKQQLKLT